MSFGNPVVGGNTLIRDAIQSSDYVPDVSGWRVAKDGTSQLDNVTIRDTSSIKDLIVTNSLTYKGISLDALLDALPKGIVAYGYKFVSPGSENWGTGTGGPLAIASFNCKNNRHYRVVAHGFEHDVSTAGRSIAAQLRYTLDGTNPTNASSILQGGTSIITYGKPSSSGVQHVEGHAYLTTGDQQIRVGLFISVLEGDSTSTESIWINSNAGGEIMYVEDTGLHSMTGVTWSTPGVIVAPVTQYDVSWYQVGFQSYASTGAKSVANGASSLAYQGYGAAVGNPDTKWGCAFFNSTDIRAQLAGATIQHCYIYLHNNHSYYNSGVTAVIGSHNADATPNTVPTSIENRWQMHVNEGGDAWTGDLGPTFAQELQAGNSRGITLGGGAAESLAYYANFNGCGIRIQFAK